MSTRIAGALSPRLLMSLAGVVVALFLLSGLVATIWGREPDNAIADALGTIGWFGFFFGAVALLVLTVTSLVARAISRSGSAPRRETT